MGLNFYARLTIREGKKYLYSTLIGSTAEAETTASLQQSQRMIIILLVCTLVFLWIGFILLYFSRESYKRLANHDLLTGAYSRIYLDRWKENEAGTLRKEEIIAIIMIDINKFKSINDQFGHLVGDKVLKKVVSILKQSTRKSDFVVRYGGDEFLLILSDTTEKEAQKVMERVEERLKYNKKFEFPIEISFGIEEVSNREKLHEAIKIADEKMYRAKRKKYDAEA